MPDDVKVEGFNAGEESVTDKSAEGVVEEKPADVPAEEKPAETPAPVESEKPAEEKPAEAKAAESVPGWVQPRLDELTRLNHALKRELEQAKTAKPAETPAEGEKAAVPTMTTQELQKLINEQAANIAQTRAFQEKAGQVYQNGKKEFDKSFDTAIANLTAVGAIGENGNADFVKAVTELEDGHKVLNQLGTNPDEAARILQLPPIRMAMELARIEEKVKAPKKVSVSSAPNPITPVNASSKDTTVDLYDDASDVNSWIAQRNKEVAERRARR